MKIDLLKYKNNIRILKSYLTVNASMSFSDKMTNYSVATHVPLIVVAYYIMKIEGPSEEFNETIKRLIAFYKYDEIIGIDELMEL
jgi:hypothetical protein